jgi:uncharacterized protein (TIRG00374 family)
VNPLSRQRKILLIRIVVSAAMLALLVPRIHVKDLPDWTMASSAWFGAALVVTIIGIVISALRWDRVVVALGLVARTRSLVSHYFAGMFVANFLPSTIGGDVLRVSRLSAETGDSPSSFASVVLERLTGWIVLPVMTLLAIGINHGLLRLDNAGHLALGISLATLLLLIGVLFAAGHPRIGGRLAQKEGWTRFLGAVHLGIERFRRDPAAAFSVIIVGFAYQLTVVIAAYFAARALGIRLPPTATLAFIPAVAIVQVLPISIGGLGVREQAFTIFLSPMHIAASTAIALGLLIYALNLSASLLGAPALALGGPTSSRSTQLPA